MKIECSKEKLQRAVSKAEKITGKNATLASLIEMTYPLFVVLFTYLFYRQMYITPSVFVGGMLILVGAGLIIYNN
jgi:drug/metabolite transporter (DMT)-like permease